jgi:hypothetical protein
MRKPLLNFLFGFLCVAVTPPLLADGCFLSIVDREVTTVTDPTGAIVSQSITYWFAWTCYDSNGGYYEVPVPPATSPSPLPPTPQPPAGGCTVPLCQANCDLDYFQSIQGEFVDSPWGGPTWYKCGPLCVDLATSNRNACYSQCVEDCN